MGSSDDITQQNITALVFSLIAQFGKEGRRIKPITPTDGADILTFNLSSLLLENYEINDTDLLDMIKNNLENQQESRLSYATFIIIVVIYVM